MSDAAPPPAPRPLSLDVFLRASTSASGRRVARNAVHLYLLQGLQYALPLVTVPYLVRVLGPERYGTLGFAAGVVALLTLLADYGFALSATRRISVLRDDAAALGRTAAGVWAAKILLALAALAGLLAAILAVPRLRAVAPILWLLCGRLAGNVLTPHWLFQGLERMNVLTFVQLAHSVLITACVFGFIREPSDYVLLAGLQGLVALITGALAAGIGAAIVRLRPALPAPAEIRGLLREGFALFLSTSCVSAYTTANSVILGLLTSDVAVGYYVAAEKIVNAVRGLMAPIANATYPRLSRLASESKEKALYWSRYVLLLMGGTGAALGLALVLAAPLVTRIVLGPQFLPSVPVIRILAPLTLLVGLSNVFGIQIMLPFGWDRAFTAILMTAGAVNLALAVALAPAFEAVGMAVAVLSAELYVTLTMAIYLLARHVNPFTGAFHAAAQH
jgi:O-antigen/teichoic acid export membrane protein